MNAQMKAELENAHQCLLDTYQMYLEHGGLETPNPMLYCELAAELADIKENSRRNQEALDIAKESRTMDEFEQKYKQLIQDRDQRKYDSKKSSEYKQFKQQLQQIQEAAKAAGTDATGSNMDRGEYDDIEVEGEINVFDPMTKKRMRSPVRNTKCGHHYEKSYILEALTINKRLTCPVAGCGNKQFLLKEHLQDDNVFKMRLQKAAEQEFDSE